MKIKSLGIFALITVSMTINAYAKDVFNFSGLNWKDSILTVNSKLKAAGNSGLSTGNMIGCLVRQFSDSICPSSFDGPSLHHGVVWFQNGKLIEVNASVNDIENTLTLLIQKYGKPIFSGVEVTGEGIFTSRYKTFRWDATNGEELSVRGNEVSYISGLTKQSQNIQRTKEDARF